MVAAALTEIVEVCVDGVAVGVGVGEGVAVVTGADVGDGIGDPPPPPQAARILPKHNAAPSAAYGVRMRVVMRSTI